MKNVTTTKKCADCGLCCYFTKEQTCLAPYFSKREARLVDKKKLKKASGNLFQAKVVKSIKKEGFFVCLFLDEAKYKCSIYKKRPIDCVTWPFIVGWDKGKKDLYLWIADGSFCPAVKNVNEIKRSSIVDEVINYLKTKNFFKEVKNGERYLWPYESYQVKIKRITELIS